ncbi:HAD family hydrolase [Corynebacterium alimapuense]|uniref:HAD family hydrolase n=1 Tax=Corynebacterium alimapuense TaxID=1576874 RepID=A0A3M8K632_9CORY|nr:HAD family hydrolase [Corynebacterium alimapuense]RNE48570.1 HAD family hydrolase [Corynebacterium alimapuense]
MEHRLIALDMDGTLLDGQGAIPEGFWDVLSEATSRGITIAPASGRQLATLRSMFSGQLDPGTYIAENGTCVFHNGSVVSTTELDPLAVHAIIDSADEFDLVICTPEMAYIQPELGPETRAEIDKYYFSTTEVSDLHEVAEQGVIKVAAFTNQDAEAIIYPVIKAAAPDENVVVSGAHWVDVMSPNAGKGRALLALADTLGIPQAQTLAFGDYLNDLELLETAGTAYAMANAHPKIKAIADHIAPANTEYGVVTVLKELLAD